LDAARIEASTMPWSRPTWSWRGRAGRSAARVRRRAP
jgi:hypothetical protein